MTKFFKFGLLVLILALGFFAGCSSDDGGGEGDLNDNPLYEGPPLTSVPGGNVTGGITWAIGVGHTVTVSTATTSIPVTFATVGNQPLPASAIGPDNVIIINGTGRAAVNRAAFGGGFLTSGNNAYNVPVTVTKQGFVELQFRVAGVETTKKRVAVGLDTAYAVLTITASAAGGGNWFANDTDKLLITTTNGAPKLDPRHIKLFTDEETYPVRSGGGTFGEITVTGTNTQEMVFTPSSVGMVYFEIDSPDFIPNTKITLGTASTVANSIAIKTVNASQPVVSEFSVDYPEIAGDDEDAELTFTITCDDPYEIDRGTLQYEVRAYLTSAANAVPIVIGRLRAPPGNVNAGYFDETVGPSTGGTSTRPDKITVKFAIGLGDGTNTGTVDTLSDDGVGMAVGSNDWVPGDDVTYYFDVKVYNDCAHASGSKSEFFVSPKIAVTFLDP